MSVWKTKRRSRTGNLRHFTCATGEPCASTSVRNVLWRGMTWKFVQKQLLFLWTDFLWALWLSDETYLLHFSHLFWFRYYGYLHNVFTQDTQYSSCHTMHVKIMSSVNAPLHSSVNCFCGHLLRLYWQHLVLFNLHLLVLFMRVRQQQGTMGNGATTHTRFVISLLSNQREVCVCAQRENVDISTWGSG